MSKVPQPLDYFLEFLRRKPPRSRRQIPHMPKLPLVAFDLVSVLFWCHATMANRLQEVFALYVDTLRPGQWQEEDCQASEQAFLFLDNLYDHLLDLLSYVTTVHLSTDDRIRRNAADYIII